ncbi:MAG: RidA family protein [Dehalococcoidia bacterium]|nr:RidA family protein [Dehalococcoidia bacterium]
MLPGTGDLEGIEMDVDARLKELGIVLPPPFRPMANYVPAVRSGNLVFVSGHGPNRPDGTFITGKLGRDLGIEQGYEAARLTMLNCLSSLNAELGSLNRVRRFVKVLGMVNCTEDFGDPPAVINGGSDLLVEIFGDAGRHARSAVGMQSLPRGIAVEIELIAEVE